MPITLPFSNIHSFLLRALCTVHQTLVMFAQLIQPTNVFAPLGNVRVKAQRDWACCLDWLVFLFRARSVLYAAQRKASSLRNVARARNGFVNLVVGLFLSVTSNRLAQEAHAHCNRNRNNIVLMWNCNVTSGSCLERKCKDSVPKHGRA